MRNVSRSPERNRGLVTPLSILLVIAFLLVSYFSFRGTFFVNLSPSIPVGLYLRQESAALKVGDTVVLRVNERVRGMAVRVGLLEHTKLLFKRVLALPGERFCFEEDVLQVGYKELKLRRETSRGVVLPRGEGCSVLSDSEYLVIGDTADSFDSRYFGAVKSDDVVAKVRPVVTF